MFLFIVFARTLNIDLQRSDISSKSEVCGRKQITSFVVSSDLDISSVPKTPHISTFDRVYRGMVVYEGPPHGGDRKM